MENLCINAIRNLCIDTVESANSGHPGMPMGAAAIGYALFHDHLKISPQQDTWFNRDRFVLSAGHASSLLYALLHLSGFDISIEDMKQFRQWGSKTPGHPEVGLTPGVDATTGPLGQGIAMGVGMALAECHLAARFNQDHYNIIDHYTYVLCGDGDMMEGVSSEACSFAGHHKLEKLILIYDANKVTLDGDLCDSFSEDVAQRYQSYGWRVYCVEDGNNASSISEAITRAKATRGKPTLIIVNTVIGYGSPNKSNSHKVHGAPLGPVERALTREALNWHHDEFEIPDEVYQHMSKVDSGQRDYCAWQDLLGAYKEAYPELYKTLFESELIPSNLDFNEDKMATRESSGHVLNHLALHNELLLGGSADLASSNKTALAGFDKFSATNYGGRNICYGVREFAMAGIMNGMILHGGLKTFVSTFLVFSDYLRPALRLSALMSLPAIYVFTHDSIAVGEDGPTHEPIEHLQSLRLIPNTILLRPCDAKETQAAWNLALSSTNTPVSLALSRQALPLLDLDAAIVEEGVRKGAYLVVKHDNPDGVLIATGSEVPLSIKVALRLEEAGIYMNVVSMPSVELFEKQPQSYQESIIDPTLETRIAVEMGATRGWCRYATHVYGIDCFGESAPMHELVKHFGFDTASLLAYCNKHYGEKLCS